MHKTIHKAKDNDEDMDKTIHKAKDNDEDMNKDQIINKTIVKIEDKDEDKTRSECKDENMLTKVYFGEEMELINNNYWIRRKTFKIFWKNNTISELCEKWIFYNDNSAYIRLEEHLTLSGEWLYKIREHKVSLSKKNHATTQILMS